jgi:hypothetical protein
MSTIVGICFDISKMCRNNFLKSHTFVVKWEGYVKEHMLQIS